MAITSSANSKCTIVVFDGLCGMCDTFVQFLLHADKHHHLMFVSFQSDAGQTLLSTSGLATTPETLYVVTHNQHVLAESTAVLHVLRMLPLPYSLLAVFRVLPTSTRDGLYRIIARNRYRIFGKRSACRVPTPEEQSRFVM
jgi:predicted DCC family thiol-disulfide oxidoreductase YuxK